MTHPACVEGETIATRREVGNQQDRLHALWPREPDRGAQSTTDALKVRLTPESTFSMVAATDAASTTHHAREVRTGWWCSNTLRKAEAAEERCAAS